MRQNRFFLLPKADANEKVPTAIVVVDLEEREVEIMTKDTCSDIESRFFDFSELDTMPDFNRHDLALLRSLKSAE